ncbi:MAG TPA: cystathionine beta-synthase [Anaerolineales bacterium]|nr:cystathionine beta-synthase [Anaerolineales bacterium]
MSVKTSSGLETSDSLRVYNNILESIGKTPLVRLNRVARGLPCPLYAKIEFLNPGGSVKDRIGLNMITEAEQSGRLKPGGTVVESTSGNTGAGLAIACAIKGYKAVFVMPDKMSQEKIQLLRAFGARVVITPTAVEPDDPRSYYSVAERLVSEIPNAILADQYHNPENPRSHYLTTGPEIWEQTQGRVTDVVLGMGTGGTITGVGRYLKEQNPQVRMVGVDPTGSILLEAWQQGGLPADVKATSYKVEGIGEDFLPSTLDLSFVDEVVRVTDKESFWWTRRLVKEEGIFCGGSSGSALAGAVRYAAGLDPDRLVVVILPDSGSRYLSKVFDDKWMRENGFLELEWAEVPLFNVLATKSSQALITASVSDRMSDVIALMKAHDISQVPALDPQGNLAGLVTEVDLLKHMLEAGHDHSPDETIAPIVQPAEAVFPAQTPLQEVLPAVVDGYVILVSEAGRPVGILTKIDVLDFIAQRT